MWILVYVDSIDSRLLKRRFALTAMMYETESILIITAASVIYYLPYNVCKRNI